MSLKYTFDKRAQSLFGRAEGQPTIRTLLNEIAQDQSATLGERVALTAQISSSAGNIPRTTPLGYVGSAILGGTAANLAGKYFNMGPMGRTVATMAGMGIGTSLYSDMKR